MPKVFFDIDGTIIRGKTQIIALSYLWKKHRISFFFPVKFLLWSIKCKILSLFRKRDFIPLLMQNMYFCLKGKEVDEMAKLYQKIFQAEIKPRMIQETVQALKQHQKQGGEILLISTSIEPLARLIGDYLNVNKVIASKLEVDKGKYTGRITRVVYKKEKLKIAKNLGYNSEQSFFYTDSYSDIFLLEQVGHPVAVDPDYKLRKRALKEKWVIIDS